MTRSTERVEECVPIISVAAGFSLAKAVDAGMDAHEA
jgi:hypothetical protein